MRDPHPTALASWAGAGTFTLRPRSAGGTTAVAAALARKLAALATRPERWAVIVAADGDGANRFTQVLVDRHAGAWVEAASNEFLAPAHHRGDDQHRLLALFGFAPPENDHPNHWQILEPPVDWTRVAWLLVGTLEDVDAVSTDDDLTVTIIDVGRPSDQGDDDIEDGDGDTGWA